MSTFTAAANQWNVTRQDDTWQIAHRLGSDRHHTTAADSEEVVIDDEDTSYRQPTEGRRADTQGSNGTSVEWQLLDGPLSSDFERARKTVPRNARFGLDLSAQTPDVPRVVTDRPDPARSVTTPAHERRKSTPRPLPSVPVPATFSPRPESNFLSVPICYLLPVTGKQFPITAIPQDGQFWNPSIPASVGLQ